MKRWYGIAQFLVCGFDLPMRVACVPVGVCVSVWVCEMVCVLVGFLLFCVCCFVCVWVCVLCVVWLVVVLCCVCGGGWGGC